MITIHSDDFGYNQHTDKKILHLLKERKIKSLSVLSTMVNQKSLQKLKSAVDKNPAYQIGLHVNLVEGKSIYGKEYIPSLVDKKGQFFALTRFIVLLFFGRIEKDHIKKEIKSQIKKMRNKNLNPQFIDSHRHVHAVSPVAEIVEEIAKEANIGQIRSYNLVKTYTTQAKIKYLFLKLTAAVSYFISYGKVGLPASWKQNGAKIYSFSSWEGKSIYFLKTDNENLVLVTHPYLPFDNNKSYMPLFSV